MRDGGGQYHRQMLCSPAQLEEARDVTALGGVLPAPLSLWEGEREKCEHSCSWCWWTPAAAQGHLTLQAVGVKLDVALAAAGGFHDHLHALPLDAGQRLGAGLGYRSCRQVPAGCCVPAENPHPGIAPSQVLGVTDPKPLPFLGTNCDVTPTSKVAKTGEWSLVTMSSVQPG